MITEQDIEFMSMAAQLAGKGAGFVHPNPYVGAVVVKSGKVIGEGWHKCCGQAHAERNAFANLTESADGATLYVTLEPCCHYGKTPPCTQAVIENHISRVVVGLKDPNPKVGGKGIEQLKAAGMEVECGVLELELKEQNRVFLKYISTGLPWVILKCAMTLDGKIATVTGDSKWISGAESRAYSQRMRSEYAAIMVGIGTVIADNPMLNCRLNGAHQPIRIVVDSNARISLDTNLVQSAGEYRTIVVHTNSACTDKLEQLRVAKVETLLCATDEYGHVDVPDMLKKLGEAGIDSIILEGGGELNDSFVRAKCVDECYFFVSPKIVGGGAAKSPVSGVGCSKLSDAVHVEISSTEKVGEDILIRGKFSK